MSTTSSDSHYAALTELTIILFISKNNEYRYWHETQIKYDLPNSQEIASSDWCFITGLHTLQVYVGHNYLGYDYTYI